MDKSQSPQEAVKPTKEGGRLSDFKKALGAVALTLSDDEIKRLYYTFERFADAVFDRWLEKRNAGLLDMDETV